MNMLMLPRASGIYRILNTVNGKCYIGSAKNMYGRQSVHLSDLRKGRHPNAKLQNAFNKYGEDAFIFEVAEFVEDKFQLIPREQYYIDTLKPEYNIAPNAGSNLGFKPPPSFFEKRKGHPVSEATRKRLSDLQKGKFPEHLRPYSTKGMPGHPVSEKTSKQISATLQNHPVSIETRTRIGNSNRGQKRGPMPAERKAKISTTRKERYKEGKYSHIPPSRKNKRASKALRLKLSLAHIGLPSPKKGIPMSEKQKKKVSIAKKTINLLRKGLPISPKEWVQGELWDSA